MLISSQANPLWGAPHIHGELLKLGFDVALYLCCCWRSPSQGWRTFLSNHTDGIAAVDLLVLPTITSLRAASAYNGHSGSVDHTSITVARCIEVERLIGSIRRGCLNRMIVFGEAHLRRIVGAYGSYYNEARTHRSLNKDGPFHCAIQRFGAITSPPGHGSLHHQFHHQYCRI